MYSVRKAMVVLVVIPMVWFTTFWEMGVFLKPVPSDAVSHVSVLTGSNIRSKLVVLIIKEK